MHLAKFRHSQVNGYMNSKKLYEVLGLEKAADQRTIKKAYFGLVRKYPPETHPEEFKQIREAYEVLSDAHARQEYDSLIQYDDEQGEAVAGKIRVAMEAIEQDRYLDAQAILASVLDAQPDLAFVKDLLGIAFLRNKQPEQALKLFVALVGAHPQNAAYHLHAGDAYHALGKYAEAEAAYRQARVADKDDVRPLVSLADSFIEQRRWDDAMLALDEAINLDGTVDFRDFALFLRKVQVEMLRQRPDAMAAVLAQLVPLIPDEPAAKKLVATRLGSLAASLFGQKRSNEANFLLREASKIDPTRVAGPMPPSFVVDLEQLPETSKQWLIDQNKKHSVHRLEKSSFFETFILFAIGAGSAFIAHQVMATANLSGFAFALVGSLNAVGLMLSAYAVQRWSAAGKSVYGSYVFAHPLYLLDVAVDHVTVWPMANLRAVRVTHNHTNGHYKSSHVEVDFDSRTFLAVVEDVKEGSAVVSSGKDRAAAWANEVTALHRRFLELMHSGTLEDAWLNENLIPPSLIRKEVWWVRLVPPELQVAPKKGAFKIYLLAAALSAATILWAHFRA